MQDKISLSDLSLTEIVATAVNSVLSGDEPDGLEWFEAMNDASRNYIIDTRKLDSCLGPLSRETLVRTSYLSYKQIPFQHDNRIEPHELITRLGMLFLRAFRGFAREEVDQPCAAKEE